LREASAARKRIVVVSFPFSDHSRLPRAASSVCSCLVFGFIGSRGADGTNGFEQERAEGTGKKLSVTSARGGW